MEDRICMGYKLVQIRNGILVSPIVHQEVDPDGLHRRQRGCGPICMCKSYWLLVIYARIRQWCEPGEYAIYRVRCRRSRDRAIWVMGGKRHTYIRFQPSTVLTDRLELLYEIRGYKHLRNLVKSGENM